MTGTADTLEQMAEAGRWRARDVSYLSGRWEKLKPLIPTFALGQFKAGDDFPANPHMQAVIRQPRTTFEHPIPVGLVSKTYSLAQHTEVAEQCFDGIRKAGIDPAPLRCELGLTELGEWMNLRIYFPEQHRHEIRSGDAVNLRLECFNSVDGSSRLVILFGWLRLVCANGMVIGETLVELRDIHNKNLTLEPIPDLVCKGLEKAGRDLARLHKWEATRIPVGRLEPWVNKDVTDRWGKKAACRVFHICRSGQDVDLEDPFAAGEATEKPVVPVAEVPGSVTPSKTLFDASQALSWVATQRNNPEERVEWQRGIPELVGKLAKSA